MVDAVILRVPPPPPPPPGLTFRDRYLHSKNNARAENAGVGQISLRAARKQVVWCWHLLCCGVIDLVPGAEGVGGVGLCSLWYGAYVRTKKMVASLE